MDAGEAVDEVVSSSIVLHCLKHFVVFDHVSSCGNMLAVLKMDHQRFLVLGMRQCIE